jgi:hypothetical protein
MSLSSDFLAARHKSSSLFEGLCETHPFLASVGTLAVLTAALITLTRVLLIS